MKAPHFVRRFLLQSPFPYAILSLGMKCSLG